MIATVFLDKYTSTKFFETTGLGILVDAAHPERIKCE
jgi:precorrin-6x reductase